MDLSDFENFLNVFQQGDRSEIERVLYGGRPVYVFSNLNNGLVKKFIKNLTNMFI